VRKEYSDIYKDAAKVYKWNRQSKNSLSID
jgi:hypothetical protein